MFYFRIRYSVAGEFNVDEQIAYICKHVEVDGDKPSLIKDKLEYKRDFCKIFNNYEGTDFPVVMVGYCISDGHTKEEIEKLLEKSEILDELSVYISLQ